MALGAQLLPRGSPCGLAVVFRVLFGRLDHCLGVVRTFQYVEFWVCVGRLRLAPADGNRQLELGWGGAAGGPHEADVLPHGAAAVPDDARGGRAHARELRGGARGRRRGAHRGPLPPVSVVL